MATYFTRNDGSWSQTVKLMAVDGAAGDFFGYVVSIDGNIVLTRAMRQVAGTAVIDAAYVFAYENGSWGQQAKLTAVTGASGDQFGFFVGLSGNTAVIGAPQDDDAGSNAGSAYTFVASGGGGGGGLQTTTIVYSYDLLYRLKNASYTGTLSGTYSYSYDAAGNRLSFSTNVTNTQTVTYTYDAANRLTESTDLTSGEVTTYDWDNAGRLITTTVNGQISRLYSYSQDSDLLQAVVDGVTTTFAYDGDGNRLQMTADGVTTTYTLDYAASFQPLLEIGGSGFTSKHYLYGVACIAEIVDEGRPEEVTRYYHRDGSNLVRQATNQNEAITYAWTYSPEGAVICLEIMP